MNIPLTERLKSIPEIFGIRVNEEPKYEVIREDGSFEVRRYEPQIRAQITLTASNFDEFRERAFKRLATFIFGENETKMSIAMTAPVLESEKISMTAPVLEEAAGDDRWTMTFILPAEFTMATAPQPIDPAIRLIEVPSETIACVRYGGNNTLEKMHEHEDKLAHWVRSQDGLSPTGAYYTAQYDAPFVIPFLKRNEVAVPVRLAH